MDKITGINPIIFLPISRIRKWRETNITLRKEYQYYKEHKAELIKKYKDRFIVIIDQRVLGDYSTREEALKEAIKKHKIGTFLVQKVIDKKVEMI